MPDRRFTSDAALLRSAVSALQRRLRAQDGADALPPTSLGILARLLRTGVANASEIAQREGLQPQSLTRALKALEDDGLIDRWADEDDRRRTLIAITGKGETLLRGTIRQRVAWLARVMENRLNSAEREIVRNGAHLIDRLAGGSDPGKPDDAVFNLIPAAQVADVARSLQFYERLGFVEDGRAGDEGVLVWASMHARMARSARIMFSLADAPVEPRKQRILFQCWTDDVAGLHARLRKDGLTPGEIAHPEHMPDGEFALTDPDGYVLHVGQIRRKR